MTPARRYLLETARMAGDRYFDPVKKICLIPRDTAWYAICLILSDAEADRRIGNELLETLVSSDGTHTPATFLAILHAIPDRIGTRATENLRMNIRNELIHAAEVEWHDGNVNHPLAACCTLVCGGELCGEGWAPELGYRRLRTIQRTIGDRRHRRRRQAEMSEYNSPTYTALDLWFLALTAEYARHPESRRLALFLEQRLWIDTAMHFHAPSGQWAGPHSRAYQADSLGGYSALHCTMLAGMGGKLLLDEHIPLRYSHPSDLIENALIAIVPFHAPAEAVEIAWRKPFPFHFRKTTYCEQYHENGSRPSDAASATTRGETAGKRTFAFDDDIYPGGWRDMTTYMTEEYALGTTSLPYVNAGQADGFMLRIRRSELVRSTRDFCSLYTRGVFNDSVVGGQNECHTTGGLIDESYLYEEGRSIIYQHRNKAIVCYAPKRAGHAGVTGFRLDLIWSDTVPFDRFCIDGAERSAFPLEERVECRIAFQTYRTFGVIIPLHPEPAADRAMRIGEVNNQLVISLYNYHGPRKDFSREEISRWRNGFVIELADTADFTSFEAFLRHADQLVVTEEPEPDGGRRIACMDGGDCMQLRCDPLRERILSRTWNGIEEEPMHMEVEAPGPETAAWRISTLFGSEIIPRPL